MRILFPRRVRIFKVSDIDFAWDAVENETNKLPLRLKTEIKFSQFNGWIFASPYISFAIFHSNDRKFSCATIQRAFQRYLLRSNKPSDRKRLESNEFVLKASFVSHPTLRIQTSNGKNYEHLKGFACASGIPWDICLL